jgi:hypothetical protein
MITTAVTSRKPTATEVMRALETMSEDDADEREMARIRALSPEELDRELAAAGIDPAESRARGERVAREIAKLLDQAKGGATR